MARGSSQLTRAAGVLLPVFSLPGKYGIGAFSGEAYRFVEFLRDAGQSYWQILPLGPTSYGDSPYQSFSTYAGNPYFIDIDELVRVGLLTKEEAAEHVVEDRDTAIDYEKIYRTRYVLLRKAYERFFSREDTTSEIVRMRGDYAVFAVENAFWLDDFALFIALKVENGGKSFLEWEKPLRLRDEAALEKARKRLGAEIGFHSFLQYLFAAQYAELKTCANRAGIRIIGDIPIYVAQDSSDVWAHPELFQLDDDCVPIAVAGCPPDAFSATGQLWGNPLYRWDLHAETGFAWWMERLKHAFSLCDVLRIDHFRGFESYYSIPYGHETAEFGHWEKGPGISFFQTLNRKLGEVPVIAEDLGFLTPEVLKLVADTGYPGMKVLQFAFDAREDSDYLPYNYDANSIVYTGTHDNTTTLAWFQEISAKDLAFAYRFLQIPKGTKPSDKSNVDAMVRLALASVSNTAIIPMQDYLRVGSKGRINHPSTVSTLNWSWRMKDIPAPALARKIRTLCTLYGRVDEE